MGADDKGGGKKPQPAMKNPLVPGDDDDSCRPRRCVGVPLPRPPVGIDRTRMQQVTEPARYAVAGKVFLAVAGALAGVLLALVAMYLYNSARRRRRRLDRSPAIAGEDYDDGASATPRGLDPAVLRALPVVVVAARDRDAGDCAVCLAELEPGEKARALPRCAHLFHVECIDAWFRGNATCPLCRADVVAPDADDAEVRVDVAVVGALSGTADAKASMAPAAMGRLPSGTDLDRTRPAFFASA